MNLPNYFMADLPADPELTAMMIGQACETIRRNRDRYLANRSTTELIGLLADVGRNWLEPENRFRKMALEQGPPDTGFSAQTLAIGLDAFFKTVTEENLEALIEQDLGDRRRLEQMTATSVESKTGRASIAIGPGLIAHVTAGQLPCSTFQSMI